MTSQSPAPTCHNLVMSQPSPRTPLLDDTLTTAKPGNNPVALAVARSPRPRGITIGHLSGKPFIWPLDSACPLTHVLPIAPSAGSMPELAVGQNPDDIDDAARKAAQEQAMAMLAAMGGGTRGAFASKSSRVPPMASSRTGTKVDQAATSRLEQAASSIQLELGTCTVVVGQTASIPCRTASRKTAEQLEGALREAEMAAMYGGMSTSFSWRVEPGMGLFEVTVKKSVV